MKALYSIAGLGAIAACCAVLLACDGKREDVSQVDHGKISHDDKLAIAVKIAYGNLLVEFPDNVGELFFYGKNIPDSSFYFKCTGLIDKSKLESRLALYMDRQVFIVTQEVGSKISYRIDWEGDAMHVKFDHGNIPENMNPRANQ